MTREALLIASWAAIAFYLYSGMKRLPRLRYRDLLRDSPLPDTASPSKRKFRPQATQISSALVALLIVAALIMLRENPPLFTRLAEVLHSVLVWMKGVDLDAVAFAPLIFVWMAVTIASLAVLMVSIVDLITVEGTSRWAPEYTLLSCSTDLGGMRREFEKELEREGKSDKRGKILSGILLVLMISLVTMTDLSPFALGAAILVFIAAAFSSRTHRVLVLKETKWRFDAAKLVLYHRRKYWRNTLRFWCTLPPIVVLTSQTIPLHVTSDDGLETYTYKRNSIIPWSDVGSLSIELCRLKDTETGPSRLDLIVKAREITIGLNQTGGVAVLPHPAHRFVAFVEKKQIPVLCSIDREAFTELVEKAGSEEKGKTSRQPFLNLIRSDCRDQPLTTSYCPTPIGG